MLTNITLSASISSVIYNVIAQILSDTLGPSNQTAVFPASHYYNALTEKITTPDPVDVARNLPLITPDLGTCETIMDTLSCYRNKSEDLALSAYHSHDDVTLNNVGVIAARIAVIFFIREHLDAMVKLTCLREAHGTPWAPFIFVKTLNSVLLKTAWPSTIAYKPSPCELSDADKLYWFNCSVSWVQDNGGVSQMRGRRGG